MKFVPEPVLVNIDSREAERYRAEGYAISNRDGVLQVALPPKCGVIKNGQGYGVCSECCGAFPGGEVHFIRQGGKDHRFCPKCCPDCGVAAKADQNRRAAAREKVESERARVAEQNREEAEAARLAVEFAAGRRRELHAWLSKLRSGIGKNNPDQIQKFFDEIKSNLSQLVEELAGELDFPLINTIKLTEDNSHSLRLSNGLGDVAVLSIGEGHLRLVCGLVEGGKARWQPVVRLWPDAHRSAYAVAKLVVEQLLGLEIPR